MEDQTSTTDEVALRRGLKRRDPKIVDRWFRENHPRVYRIAFGLLGDHQEAEDLASEAMYRILDRIGAAEEIGRLQAWSNAIVTNLCRDRLRRRKLRQTDSLIEESAESIALPSMSPVPEQRELRELITKALSRLSDREREVFVLRELEGYPTSSVAQSLGIEDSSVRSLLTMARRRLRDILSRRLGDPQGESS